MLFSSKKRSPRRLFPAPPTAWSSKDRMVKGPYLVFRFLLEQTGLNAAPVKNGPVTRPSKIPALSSKGEMWGRPTKLTIPPDTLTALSVTQLSPPENTDRQTVPSVLGKTFRTFVFWVRQLSKLLAISHHCSFTDTSIKHGYSFTVGSQALHMAKKERMFSLPEFPG